MIAKRQLGIWMMAFLLGCGMWLGSYESNAAVVEGAICQDDFWYTIIRNDKESYIDIIGYKGKEASITIPEKMNGIPVKSCSSLWQNVENAEELQNRLKEITIRSVSYYNLDGLYGFRNLEAIHVPGNSEKYGEKDGVLYEKDSKGKLTKLVRYPQGKKDETFTVSQEITDYSEAFEGVQHLKKLVIQSEQKTIQKIGAHSRIEEVVLPTNGKLKTIGEEAFKDMQSLKKIRIPSGVVSLEEKAFFRCSSLASVKLPATLRAIGPAVFGNCRALKTLTIPKRVAIIKQSGVPSYIKVKKSKYLKRMKKGEAYVYQIMVKASYKGKTKSYALNDVSKVKTTVKTVTGRKGKKIKLKVKILTADKKWRTLQSPSFSQIADISIANKRVASIKNSTVTLKKKGKTKLVIEFPRELRDEFPYNKKLQCKTTVSCKG